MRLFIEIFIAMKEVGLFFFNVALLSLWQGLFNWAVSFPLDGYAAWSWTAWVTAGWVVLLFLMVVCMVVRRWVWSLFVKMTPDDEAGWEAFAKLRQTLDWVFWLYGLVPLLGYGAISLLGWDILPVRGGFYIYLPALVLLLQMVGLLRLVWFLVVCVRLKRTGWMHSLVRDMIKGSVVDSSSKEG